MHKKNNFIYGKEFITFSKVLDILTVLEFFLDLFLPSNCLLQLLFLKPLLINQFF